MLPVTVKGPARVGNGEAKSSATKANIVWDGDSPGYRHPGLQFLAAKGISREIAGESGGASPQTGAVGDALD
ncbi:hypothetical protein [Mycobacterium genavense]|uniref:hypothetical protein n=1 Tax=Mycobacterium genavense TaxID=36812 RepID=UPI0012EB9164|nr:hypothetical protein [Mycobacterium genavense]